MTLVEGFDSRGWNGYFPPGYEHLKFAGIKISQGKKWDPKDLWMLQRQWDWAKSKYDLMRLPFHFWKGHRSWEDPIQEGKSQAYYFHNSITKRFGGDFGELPPAIDGEDRFLGMVTGKPLVHNFRACLEKTADLWNKVPGIYSAGWWWNKYIYPYLDGWKPWEEYWLWEADPPPPTPISGWGDEIGAITQVKLDTQMLGWNAVIDIDQTTQEWIDKVLGVATPDPTDPPPVEECGELKKRAAKVVLAAVEMAELL